MMIGTDIRDMTPIMQETILNSEAIAIQQDYKSPPGVAVKSTCGGSTIWVKTLSRVGASARSL